MGRQSPMRDQQRGGMGSGHVNRVVLRGDVVEGPMVVHQRSDRVVLRLRIVVAEGHPSVAVTMWDPPADLALRAMTSGPGTRASVLGHLEYMVDLKTAGAGELVVIADEVRLLTAD